MSLASCAARRIGSSRSSGSGGSGGSHGSIHPRVYVVCLGSIVILSLSFEFAHHSLNHLLQRTDRAEMVGVLDRVVNEVTVLGFIALIVAVTFHKTTFA